MRQEDSNEPLPPELERYLAICERILKKLLDGDVVIEERED